MFTLSKSRMAAYAVPAMATMVLGLSALGCNEDISENAIFTDQQAQVQRIDIDTKEMTRQIEDMSQTLSILTTQVGSIQRDPIEEDRRTHELERQILTLNKAVADSLATIDGLQARVEMQSKDLDKFKEMATSLAKTRQTVTAAPGHTSTHTATTTAAHSTSAPKPQAHRPAPTRTKTRGRYHQVLLGQSMADIAGLTGVSSSAIRAANHIPPDSEPLPGQKIFVPAGT